MTGHVILPQEGCPLKETHSGDWGEHTPPPLSLPQLCGPLSQESNQLERDSGLLKFKLM